LNFCEKKVPGSQQIAGGITNSEAAEADNAVGCPSGQQVSWSQVTVQQSGQTDVLVNGNRFLPSGNDRGSVKRVIARKSPETRGS
jgi:hypothetical protein